MLRAVAGTAKKECSFLTNEANMLLKIKDRVYERSQTKPIMHTGRLSAVTGKHSEPFHSPWVFTPGANARYE
jgi:hypothetical protein